MVPCRNGGGASRSRHEAKPLLIPDAVPFRWRGVNSPRLGCAIHPAQRLLVMTLLGPMLVVAESSAADLADVLGKAGAYPIAQTRWADVPAAIAETQPVALAIADPQVTPSPRHVSAAIEA